jgi:hypothetical protein
MELTLAVNIGSKMDNFLNYVFYYIKIVAQVQIVLVISCLLIIFLLKLIYLFLGKREEKHAQQSRALLQENLTKSSFSAKTIKKLQKKVQFALQNLIEIENYQYQSNELPRYLNLVSSEILKPRARKLAAKRHWYKKYIAALSFQYGFDPEDTPILIKLIKDNRLLISMNAAVAALKYYDGDIIDQMVDIYYKKRLLQQAVFAKLLSSCDRLAINTLLQDRIHTTTDPCMREFCEWLLNQIAAQHAAQTAS